MKTSAYVKELQAQSVEQLQAQLVDAKKELFNLRFQNATKEISGPARDRRFPRRDSPRIRKSCPLQRSRYPRMRIKVAFRFILRHLPSEFR